MFATSLLNQPLSAYLYAPSTPANSSKDRAQSLPGPTIDLIPFSNFILFWCPVAEAAPLTYKVSTDAEC